MTPTPTTANDNASPPSSPTLSAPARFWSRLWGWTQFVLCLMLTGGVLTYLLWKPQTGAPAAADDVRSAPPEVVRLAGSNCIFVQPDCPLCRKIQVATIEPVTITAPVLNVTGTVAASLRPGNGKGSDYWQFNSPELLTAFTDWQKSTADIAFAETQLGEIKQLADTRVNAEQKLVERMKKLVAAGTDRQMDLAAAEADLIQSQIQGGKEVHEAETAFRLAQRAEAAWARQLQQAGLDPVLLQSAASDLDVVMADVPEGLMSRVKIGQGCEVTFFGFPDQVFAGKVWSISPVLSTERRSLRVLFDIHDPRDQLRPGMFADIGLGTDARDAILVSPEGIVHVGRSDYVLVRGQNDDWRVTKVRVGELHETGVEIVGGLHAGDQIAGQGVILLKPFIIEVLQTPSSPLALGARTQNAPAGGRR